MQKRKKNPDSLNKTSSKKRKLASPSENQGYKEEEYEIQKIVGHRLIWKGKRIEFEVKWKGWTETTWEPFERFAYDVPEIAQIYLTKVLSEKMENKGKEEEKTFSDV